MRKLIAQMELTLDGFLSGPNGEFDWFALDRDAWKAKMEMFGRVDTVLLGRKNYEGFRHYWPNVATNPEASETDVKFSKWLDAVPKVVFSRTLERTDWQNSRLAAGALAEEVSTLKAQEGEDILVMSSASIIQACARAGLLDEYWLNIHPVALGKGRSLFEDRAKLELLESKVYSSGQVFSRYAPRAA